jgi:Flp pilus assembly pilin Flp
VGVRARVESAIRAGAEKNRRIVMSGLKRFNRDQRGIESIEYLLIAALVIIAAAGAWRLLGQRIAANVNAVAGAVDQGTDESLKAGGFSGGS